MIGLFLTIIYILITHFVADFLMQSNDMATKKSTSIKWLTLHVVSYFKGLMWSALLFYIFNALAFNLIIPPWSIVGFCVTNAVLHWVTDYFTSRETSRLWKEQKVRKFFHMIGLDQLIHGICLIMTLYLFFFQ